MYKIAILGCENSHADNFLSIIRDEKYTDVEVMGVYSHVPGEGEKLAEKYGVPVLDRFDALTGQLDGLIVTARHGDNHYKYAKPYIGDGIPMFIDKPITVSESDARTFCAELRENGIRMCGGSVCVHADGVLDLKEKIASGEYGKVLGGSLRAPINMVNEHGGFFFYSQHLVQVMCEVFGYYPHSVQTFRNGGKLTFVARYDDYDVTGLFVEGNYLYSVTAAMDKKMLGGEFGLGNTSSREFSLFHSLLEGGEMKHSYEEIFAPVFILNAMNRSMQSGREEKVGRMGDA